MQYVPLDQFQNVQEYIQYQSKIWTHTSNLKVLLPFMTIYNVNCHSRHKTMNKHIWNTY